MVFAIILLILCKYAAVNDEPSYTDDSLNTFFSISYMSAGSAVGNLRNKKFSEVILNFVSGICVG